MVDLTQYNLRDVKPSQPWDNGHKIDYARLSSELLERADTLLPAWFPRGKKLGREFKVGNLAGAAGESLSINTHTGVWKDFAIDEGGSDLIALYAARSGMSQHDAAMELSRNDPPTTNCTKVERAVAPIPPKTRNWTVALTEVAAHDCIHFSHGEPSSKWPYNNPEGELIGYVARYDKVGERKQFCPWTPNGHLWKAKKWNGIQPLYGMDLLAQRSTDPVLICEGEKAADAARKICGEEYVCITWPGGASAYKDADWEALTGRNVLLWPDNDNAGRDAAAGITVILEGNVEHLATLDVSGMAAKWDAADAIAEGWDWAQLNAWIEKQLGGSKSNPAGSTVARPKPSPNDQQNTAATVSLTSEPCPVPPELLQVPGVLGKVVEWSLRVAARPQPIYSVAAALGLGSVLMGRRYRSDYGNWTPIYFLVMGRTSTGKEHIKKTVSAVMVAAKLDCLIGGSQYTSDEAVHNELREHATSIHVTDEFGIQLKAAKSAGSSHPQNVNRVFMELFSECDGFNRGKAFSTAGLNKNHREEFSAERRKLIKPSLTIVAITTPDIFYEEIGSASLCNGFLNRFIGMECHSPASKSVKKKVPAHDQVVPPEVVAWARKTRFGDTCDEEDAGNLVGLISDVPAYEEPTPWEMSFSESTEPLLDEIDEFCVDRLNDKTDPLGDMWGRTREQAMRLAMIIARSCNSTAIELEHLNWAVKFVKFWTSQMVKAASSNISDNAIDAAIKDVRRLLALAGPAGQSRTQLSNASRKYRALLPRQQSEIWSHLQIDSEHGVHERVGKRGPATKVLILTTLLEREDA